DYWRITADNLRQAEEAAAQAGVTCLETAEIPEKLLFQVSLLPEMLSVQKAFTLLTSALRHHTIALFEFPLIRFHQTDTPVFHGMVRLISLI
ncbi:hypothetical protein PNE73_25530, partial [Escherichia coli]|nr:hypothetical protein [Escherichia coli]